MKWQIIFLFVFWGAIADPMPREKDDEPVLEIQFYEDDSQDCTLDDDTGLCCMIKEMEYETIQKEPILECEHLIEKKCHHTYITQFDSEEEEVCEENYEKICQVTFKKELVTEDVKRCIKSLVKTCDGRGETECKTVDETVCTTKYGDPVPLNCSAYDDCTDPAQGTCDTSTGLCVCERGFAGDNCAEISRYYQRGLVDVSQNNLVATFPQWSRHYEIEFDIIVQDKSGLTDEYVNVFHMSSIDTVDGAGSKIPGVWVNKDYFKFCCGDNDCMITDEDDYQLDTLYHFKITQELLDGEWIFRARHIDFKLYHIVNPNPKAFENVKLYVSDPWAPSFTSHGIVSNLEVTDLAQNEPIVVSDEELKAHFCLIDADEDDNLSISEMSDKIGQFHTLLKTGYHDQNTADIKDIFDVIDKDSNEYISFVEWMEFAKSNTGLNVINFDNRLQITDRLTNALASSHFETNDKVKAVTGFIFCACDKDGNNQISKTEIEDEDCLAIQKSTFHDNYITEGGFDFLRQFQADADDSYFTLAEADAALTDLIDRTQEYYKFFTGVSSSVRLGLNDIAEVMFNDQWVPICGHWFWEGTIGADLFCQQLGFESGEVNGRRDLSLPSDGLRVGQCLVGDSWDNGVKCSQPDCNQLELGGKCNNGGNCAKGQNAAITIDCKGRGRFLNTKRRQAMSDVESHREGRWLGKTTCELKPVEFCGAGCIIEEGPEFCKDEKLYSLVDKPMEMCDINPRQVCKTQTKLVPKLMPVEECTEVPREKCALNFTPNTVQKSLKTKWCRPNYPGDTTENPGF